MFVVAPLKTDAAIDHYPYATGAIIATSTLVALLLGFPEAPARDYVGEVIAGWEPPFVNSLALRWGQFNPINWVTYAFVHFGWVHLIFNMIFLWTFGLVVEGYVGWRRFLALYGLAAVVPGAIVQVLMLGQDAGRLAGASAAVYGIMAIAALWAPRNRLTLFVWILIFIRKPEVSVWGFCLLWVSLDVVSLVLSGFAVSSAMVHLLGAATGAAAGIYALKKAWVDCEGWDYLSLRERGPPRPVLELKPEAEPMPERVPEDPLARMKRMRDVDGLDEHVREHADNEARLVLVRFLLEDRRPTRALEHLEQLPESGERARLEERARAMRDAPGLELE